MNQVPLSSRDERAKRLAALEREYTELRANLPAHSTPPALLIRLEELEDAITELRAALAGELLRSDR
jgi:ribosomal protein L29